MRQCFVFAIVLVCFASSCSKEADPSRKFVSFQLDSLVVLSENPTAILTAANLTDTDPDNDYPSLKITGTGNHNETITFTLISETDSLRTGSYPSTQRGNGMAISYTESNSTLLADNTNGSLTFDIGDVQDSTIECYFVGSLVDTTGVLSNRQVTNGFIRAVVKRN
ncbi:hypothetical protein SAMN05518672_1011269 [Chitinophaga sp. CF118]|uniref:hypothetical protein n=1 Tax=Chitinophaga sp. CF118 TaxID=1884367 RepID=UPI0008EC627C|nr:hypothetical protein [Chitinophaga sp. CF118]SFD25073.1 hypothetical protein SAMN05518672_1011269 [Chitinophaga sp. CF118]